jgi:hypothetical protein
MTPQQPSDLDRARTLATHGYAATIIGGVNLGMALVITLIIAYWKHGGTHISTLGNCWAPIQCFAGITFICFGSSRIKQAVDLAASTQPTRPRPTRR